ATAVEFTEDGGDATGAVDILHVVVRVRCDLGQAGHALGQHVDVSQVEVDLTLLGGGEDVQDGVGGTTHGHIECHGDLEGLLGGDGARQGGLDLLAVVRHTKIEQGHTR